MSRSEMIEWVAKAQRDFAIQNGYGGNNWDALAQDEKGASLALARVAVDATFDYLHSTSLKWPDWMSGNLP